MPPHNKSEARAVVVARAFFKACTKLSDDSEDILPQEDAVDNKLSVFHLFAELFPEFANSGKNGLMRLQFNKVGYEIYEKEQSRRVPAVRAKPGNPGYGFRRARWRNTLDSGEDSAICDQTFSAIGVSQERIERIKKRVDEFRNEWDAVRRPSRPAGPGRPRGLKRGIGEAEEAIDLGDHTRHCPGIGSGAGSAQNPATLATEDSRKPSASDLKVEGPKVPEALRADLLPHRTENSSSQGAQGSKKKNQKNASQIRSEAPGSMGPSRSAAQPQKVEPPSHRSVRPEWEQQQAEAASVRSWEGGDFSHLHHPYDGAGSMRGSEVLRGREPPQQYNYHYDSRHDREGMEPMGGIPAEVWDEAQAPRGWFGANYGSDFEFLNGGRGLSPYEYRGYMDQYSFRRGAEGSRGGEASRWRMHLESLADENGRLRNMNMTLISERERLSKEIAHCDQESFESHLHCEDMIHRLGLSMPDAHLVSGFKTLLKKISGKAPRHETMTVRERKEVEKAFEEYYSHSSSKEYEESGVGEMGSNTHDHWNSSSQAEGAMRRRDTEGLRMISETAFSPALGRARGGMMGLGY